MVTTRLSSLNDCSTFSKLVNGADYVPLTDAVRREGQVTVSPTSISRATQSAFLGYDSVGLHLLL